MATGPLLTSYFASLEFFGHRNVLLGIMLVERGGIFRCFVHDDELGHWRLSLMFLSLSERRLLARDKGCVQVVTYIANTIIKTMSSR